MSLLRGLAALLAVGAVLAGLLWLFQRRLIYLPDPRPARVALPGAEELAFTTADGLTLSATLVPARGGPAGTAVLVLPGNAGNRADRAPLAAALTARGLPVLLVDYRGYGGNPGRPHEAGVVADALAAYDALRARRGAERVVLYGGSLGAAVAVAVAAERPAAALVLRSPFPSLRAVARLHYPVVHWLLREDFPAAEIVVAVDAPVLVLVGAADRTVPPGLSRELHAAARGPKRLVEIPGADHNDPELLAGDRAVGAILAFLTEHGLHPGGEPGA